MSLTFAAEASDVSDSHFAASLKAENLLLYDLLYACLVSKERTQLSCEDKRQADFEDWREKVEDGSTGRVTKFTPFLEVRCHNSI